MLLISILYVKLLVILAADFNLRVQNYCLFSKSPSFYHNFFEIKPKFDLLAII